ncbi:MAG: hypothetical protein C0390_09670 [Syntrophus sp. (in: bacteria)]|nr:hypothetical protein [Syntrophus sp. (in: bacteria)]
MNVKRSVRFYLLLAACLSAMACTGQLFKNYGRINPTSETTRAFESYHVNADFRYYISGSDLYPNALMGLHRDYRLDPETLWKEVAMTPARMKEIVEDMKTKAAEYRLFQYGFEMSDDKGRPIGVWYSILSARTFLRMQENGTVRIDTPELDTYEKIEAERDHDSNN